jgi:hypothetical protein
MNRTRIAAALTTAATSAAILAACSGNGTITAHGTEMVCVDAPDITDGAQVTVKDSADHVIATGTLTADNSKLAGQVIAQYDALQATLSGLGGNGTGMSVYDFSVTVPAGLTRYGIDAGHDRGTLWFSEKQMRQSPGISLGC